MGRSKMETPEPTLDQMAAALKAAGWTRKNFSFWTSPQGKLYLGPYGAWKVMTGRGISPEFEERIVVNRP